VEIRYVTECLSQRRETVKGNEKEQERFLAKTQRRREQQKHSDG